ncbi:MAG: ATP-binding protein [Oscillospiraceae bacterium]|nr:ATP-binding protein [Oscillospiraceae bacterium]
MLYTEPMVRENIRNRDGKRVFFLDKEDRLTPGARDFLTRERIAILPAETAKPQEYRTLNGAILREKPEHMTHLHGNVLVDKTHPRIAFRGAIDSLEAELLLCQLHCPAVAKQLGEILDLARQMIRCEVLNEPLKTETLCGLTAEEQRRRSHHPQDYYGIPHFMPAASDGETVLRLNRCRCMARAAELAAVGAFMDANGTPTRPDLLQALNRMSSMIYILIIQAKSDKL